jgi:hypothetical protein
MTKESGLVEIYKSTVIEKLPNFCGGPHEFRDIKGVWEHPKQFAARRYRDKHGRFGIRKCDCKMPLHKGPKVEVERCVEPELCANCNWIKRHERGEHGPKRRLPDWQK